MQRRFDRRGSHGVFLGGQSDVVKRSPTARRSQFVDFGVGMAVERTACGQNSHIDLPVFRYFTHHHK